MTTKVVYQVVRHKNGRKYWTRVGEARVNPDGSISINIGTLPTTFPINLVIQDDYSHGHSVCVHERDSEVGPQDRNASESS